MADRRKPQDARLGDFLRDLSSPDRHTGSGAAGAIALALAAACAAKAAAITLKHEPANTRLLQARDQLLTHIDAAVRSSNEDTDRFAEFLRHRSKQTAQSVISADSKLLVLIDDVATILEALDPQVRQNVSGDLVAARALSSAARAIQIENIAEMREAKTD
jgi:formiminotetrahydrofolate cyclodeaminase